MDERCLKICWRTLAESILHPQELAMISQSDDDKSDKTLPTSQQLIHYGGTAVCNPIRTAVPCRSDPHRHCRSSRWVCYLAALMEARGKTHISRALERYLRWMGVKTRVYSLGDYRRKVLGGAKNVPADYYQNQGGSSWYSSDK